MSPSDREDLRRRLETRAREILHETHLKVVAASAAEPPNDVPDAEEMALDDALRATAADMTDRDRGLLVAIRDAFARMLDDDYGVCEDCGEAIALERLRVVPWTTRCSDDQQRFEEGQTAAEPNARPTI